MNAVRQGATPDVAVAEATVDDMISSILRNRDALVTVSSLREYSESVFQHCVRACILTLVFGAREQLIDSGEPVKLERFTVERVSER